MDSDNVRAATDAEAIEILKGDGVRHRLSIEPQGIQAGKPYIINDRFLLIVIHHTKDACEAHIASNRANWRYIHTDIHQALNFIQELGYNQVYTNVSENLKTTANLIRKHGFELVDQAGNEGIYQWASKQH